MGAWWLECTPLPELEYISLLTSQISQVATAASFSPRADTLCLPGWSPAGWELRKGPTLQSPSPGPLAANTMASEDASLCCSTNPQLLSVITTLGSATVSGQECSSQALLLPTQDKQQGIPSAVLVTCVNKRPLKLWSNASWEPSITPTAGAS